MLINVLKTIINTLDWLWARLGRGDTGFSKVIGRP